MVNEPTGEVNHILSNVEITLIDDDSRRRFHELMLSPPAPSDSLKKLLASDAFRIVP